MFSEDKAREEIEKRYGEAETLLHDEDKLEQFLQKLEQKLRVVPVAGNQLATIPVMASMIRSYLKKEYTLAPMGTLLAILGALLYFMSPIDLVPDIIPGLGYLDDAAVVALCWKWVSADVQAYERWQEERRRFIEI